MRLPNGSGVKREFHAPFCERLVGKFCWSTLPELTKEEIAEAFGWQVANQVMNLTRIKDDGSKISSAAIVRDLRSSNKDDILLI